MFRQSRRFVLASVVLALTARFCFADAYDPPTHYYDTAIDTGFALRSDLHSIITAGYVGRSYGDYRYNMATKDVDGTLKTSIDQDPNNPNNILLIYNRASITGVWDAGATWN
jgi:hypothetical protein